MKKYCYLVILSLSLSTASCYGEQISTPMQQAKQDSNKQQIKKNSTQLDEFTESKQEVVNIPDGKLVFNNYIYTDENLHGYYQLDYINERLGKTFPYANHDYGFSFVPTEVLVSPNKKFSLIQVIEQGYVEEELGNKKLHEVLKAFVLENTTGCVSDTGLVSAKWSKHNKIVNTGYPEGELMNVKTEIYKFINPEYPWTDTKNFIGQNSEETIQEFKKAELKSFLASDLGISNLVACTPITKDNVKYYTYLYNELKKYGFNLEASKINGAILEFNKHAK